MLPDWLTALMLGKLQAVAAAAGHLGYWPLLQGRGLEGCWLSPWPSHPSELHPVPTDSHQKFSDLCRRRVGIKDS